MTTIPNAKSPRRSAGEATGAAFLRHLAALLGIVAVGALLLPVPAHADDSETLRTLKINLTSGDAESLRLDVPVGEVQVEGTDGNQVVVRVALNCNRPVKERCREMARKVELSSGNSGSTLQVELDGWPKNLNNSGLSAAVEIQMPRQLGLRAELGVGEFRSVGLISDLSLDIGVGEANIRAREADVRRVNLEVGVGEAILRTRDRDIEGSGFIGRDLAWSDGPGKANLKVDCGVGEVDVRLDE